MAADVVVIGGGVIGLSIAWELAEHGVPVKVLDQGRTGREASWAGAGMLPPGNPARAHDGESRLRALSCSMWPDWTSRLRESTGIDNGYLRCGAFRLSFERALRETFSAWQNEGVRAELLDRSTLQSLEPALSPEFIAGIHLPDQCQVRNPWHMKALLAACHQHGVEIREGVPVTNWERGQSGRLAARTPSGLVEAGQFIIASGAWTQPLLAGAGIRNFVEPVRGQIALLRVHRPAFTRILEVGSRYLVPRGDGRILVGSTEERVGFVKQNTAKGIRSLLDFAVRVVPGLQDAELEQCWSGLRPHSGRELPLIGAVPGTDNVFVAAGHFRSGLQMSPATALLMRQIILNQEPSIPMTPYSVSE